MSKPSAIEPLTERGVPEPRTYATSEAFRRALEDRLNNMARERGLDLARLRRMVAFERLLARLFKSEPAPWVLKGGYALEVRFRRTARSTRDIDMSLPELRPPFGGEEIASDKVLAELTRAAAADLGDWFLFQIGTQSAELDARPHGGFRFPVTSRLAEREFTTFHLDVALGDAVVSEPEWVNGHDLLSFAGIAPAKIALLPREQHFAEKIHAYTLRGDGSNSRVRDLADLVILINEGPPDPEQAVRAIRATFDRRKTHPVPSAPSAPPEAWSQPYREIAAEISLTPNEAEDAFDLVQAYWNRLKFEEQP